MAKNFPAALALMGVSAAAGAAPVTISETISLSQLLSGNSTKLSFDINSQLSSFGLGKGDILSGELVVFGYSDAQYNSQGTGSYSDYVTTGTSGHVATMSYQYPYYVPGYCYSYYSFWSGTHYSCYSGYTAWATGYYGVNVTDYDTTRFRDNYQVDGVQDSMSVSAGGSSASGAVDGAMQVSTGSYGQAVYERTDGDYYNGYLYRYNRERDVYEAISGEMQASLSLDLLALDDLMKDGRLDPLVTSTLGHVDLTKATLTVLAQARDVPEPGSLALMALAGAGAVAARRRKPKQDAASKDASQ